MGEAASSESALAAGADAAGQVADCLAALENPAAALRDALSGLSAAELNLFGSSLAQLARPNAPEGKHDDHDDVHDNKPVWPILGVGVLSDAQDIETYNRGRPL